MLRVVERVDIIDGFIRCNRREAFEFYQNGIAIHLTVNDNSPLASSPRKYSLVQNYQFSDDTFKQLLAIFEKRFCTCCGDWLSLFIDGSDIE